MTPPPVLYVEDDDNDVLLMRRAWAWVAVENPLQVVTDGEKALRYLSGDGPYANQVDYPMPCLVLLDLKMPKVTGLDVLRWIRSQPAFRIFESSSTPPRSYHWTSMRPMRCGSKRIFVKPESYDEWVAMVDNLNVH